MKDSRINEEECNKAVYERGFVVGFYDMPGDVANKICKAESKRTGDMYDWHYVGGRVVVKCLPSVKPKNLRYLVSRNKREGWYAGKCRIYDFITSEMICIKHHRDRFVDSLARFSEFRRKAYYE